MGPQANVRAQDMVEILKGEARGIPETNGAEKRRKEVTEF